MAGAIRAVMVHLSRKAVFKCDEEYKKRFKNSTCLLTISVGQEVHEGEKFFITTELVSKNFKEVIVLVDDSLQRHSLRIFKNMSDLDAYNHCINLGEQWLLRNQTILSNLPKGTKIIRWDKWLNHENFNSYKNKILNEYKSNPIFKQAIDHSTNQFMDRLIKRAVKLAVTHQEANALCFDYLIEECTALCLWQELDIDFEVYPNKRNSAMSATHEIFIQPQSANKLLPVAIKFKNRSQFKPQSMSIKPIESTD